MPYLDPTVTRISQNLLLSDLMGCDSVYRYGFQNRFDAKLTQNLAEGRHLGELLDQIQDVFGPFFVCYGYISPSLSKQIVTYQDPNKPSYHRWDIGAAADIHLPHWTEHGAPIYAAFEIDERLSYSRLITYSESEWLCLATSLREKDTPGRRALYENRFVGVRKPQYIRYSDNERARAKQKEQHKLSHDWRGTGYPQYHGKGRLQFEHEPVSRYTTRIAFLYDRDLVHAGHKNLPPLTKKDLMVHWDRCAAMAGAVIDKFADTYNARISITKAYNATVPAQRWERRFTLELVPPTSVDRDDAAHVLSKVKEVASVTLSKHKEPRIQVTGHYL